MNSFYQSDVPVLINITLFKHNYYDNKVLSLIKQKSQYYRKEADNKITVSAYDIKNIVLNDFSVMLADIKDSTPLEFTKKVNSVYFLDQFLERYSNLRYFTINISDDKNCSRLFYPQGDQGPAMINFDFKVIHSILDFPNHLASEDLKFLNLLLREVGIIYKDAFRSGPPYLHVHATDFLDKIDLFVNKLGPDSAEIKPYETVLILISELVDTKIEQDNPTCLLITDYSK